MVNSKASRLQYAQAAFDIAPTTGTTGLAYDRMRRVMAGEDKRAPLVRFAEELIERHDKQANDDVPPIDLEDGLMTCGCTDCRLAQAALDAEGIDGR